jgi:hypothetical protein
MSIDYEEWNHADAKVGNKAVQHHVDEYNKGRKPSLTLLLPEHYLDPLESFTTWEPPGEPSLAELPTAKLANLCPYYDRIIVPIMPEVSKHHVEYSYQMPLDTLVQIIKGNPAKYIPVITVYPLAFKGARYYDELFGTCRKLYGHYPSFLAYRTMGSQSAVAIAVRTNYKVPLEPIRS